MAKVKFYDGFTFSQLNHQVFVPTLVNPEFNASKSRFESDKAEAIAPNFEPIGSHKVVLKGNFKMFGTTLTGAVKSIKLVGPNGKLYEITEIKGVSLWDYIVQTMNLPLNPTALTELVFADGVSMSLGGGNDQFDGTDGRDVVKGGGGDDELFGGNRKDFLYGQNGEDTINGGAGNDNLFGGDGDDFLFDYLGDNKLSGGEGDDDLFTGNGKDEISGGAGNDSISSGQGKDDIKGGSGSDIISAGSGADKVDGGKGHDTISGNGGNDKIDGNNGNDWIDGGSGKDILKGGRGHDQFVFVEAMDSGLGKDNRDVIKDFDRGVDVINLVLIDAGSAEGDQAFTFIGENDFSGAEGELRYRKSDDKTVVSGDIDGDGVADFQIELTGKMNLSADDFIL